MPKIPDHVRGARFTGWGTALGHKVVTNDDLAKTMDTMTSGFANVLAFNDDTLVVLHPN